MLLQTIEALKQEKQLNQELSSVLQSRISELTTRAATLRDMLNVMAKDLEELANSVSEELNVRDAAIDTLIGSK